IPVPKTSPTLTEVLKNRNQVLKKDLEGSVYMETVEHDGNNVIVQLRDGPEETPVGGNFVPWGGYRVESILSVGKEDHEGEDLIAWEKKISSAKGGAVV